MSCRSLDHWYGHSRWKDGKIIFLSNTVDKVFEAEEDNVKIMLLILSFHVVLSQSEDRKSRASINITHRGIYLFIAIRLTKPPAEMITTISITSHPVISF